MNHVMTKQKLKQETTAFTGTGGVSAENRCNGFRPAFLDTQTKAVYLSCFADGRPAPFHLLDGLPDEVVTLRDSAGRVAAVKASVISGFVLHGQFYTREGAAQKVSEAH